MRSKFTFILGIASFLLLLAVIVYLIYPRPDSDTYNRGGDLIISNARVDNVEVLVTPGNPPQVNIVAKGDLPNPCTQVDEIQSRRQTDTFYFTITAVKPHDAVCTQQIVSFEEVFPLGVGELETGTYTVNVNGVESQFTLDQPITQPDS